MATAVDIAVKDIAVDTAKDIAVDTVKDIAVDMVKDIAVDTVKDIAVADTARTIAAAIMAKDIANTKKKEV